MASPSQRAPSRRQSSTNLKTNPTEQDANSDLSQSMNKLSLSTSPVAHRGNNAPRSPSSLSPYRSAATSASPTPPSHTTPRAPSRSPSMTRESGSRASTPNLLRKASAGSLRSANGGKTPNQPPSRRSSLAHATTPNPRASLSAAVLEEPPKPLPTANSVANEYFKNELDVLHGPTSEQHSDALVILHDACYGHRFSRPKTSRAALSTIVERPERLKASALGVAMAYVRLGERHCDGAHPVHPKLDPRSIPSVPFRIHKTDRRLSLLSPAVTNVHGSKWMEELKIMCDAAEAKLAMGGKELQRPDLNRGSDGPPPKFHEGDLYLCSESINALEGALGAVCEAVDRVFTTGPSRAFVAVRPPGHHCSASYPSGFCWINNVHVGIMHAVLNHGVTHAAIIDIDLHHGDGSQDVTWQHNKRGAMATKNAAAWKKSSIGYFSLHDINSYPCEGGDDEKVKNASLCIDNAHGQNIWNVHLHSWDTEAEFWKLYETKYSVLLEKTRLYLKNQADKLRAAGQAPKAAIFLSSGFDASEWETKGMQRHNVNVPTEFYARIAQDTIKIAAEEGLSVDGRVISVLEGGYSDRALFSGVFSHLSGLIGDQTAAKKQPQEASGLGHEMAQKMEIVEENGLEGIPEAQSGPSLHAYDPTWWSSPELDRIETAMGHPPPEPKMPRYVTPPTYSSPTQASTAKIAHPLKPRRSASGLSSAYAQPVRAPSPPPPDVPWTIAAHELSKLLIPSQRQVDSCRAEELNAEATRLRRERHVAANPSAYAAPKEEPVPDRPTSRMSLRERKPTKPMLDHHPDDEDDKAKGRRKTVAGAAALAGGRGGAKRPGRRLSGVSSVASTPARKPMSRNASGTSIPQTQGDVSSGAASIPRPGSAMSEMEPPGNGPPLSVKKTRTPAASKRGGAAGRAPRGSKKSTPARATSRTGESQSMGPPSPIAMPPPPPTAPPATAVPNDDIDGITSGMKKIKINLITKSQKQERERAAAAASASASAAATPRTETPPALDYQPAPVVSPLEGRGPAPIMADSPVTMDTPQVRLPSDEVQSLDVSSEASHRAPSPLAPSISGLVTPDAEDPPAPSGFITPDYHQQQQNPIVTDSPDPLIASPSDVLPAAEPDMFVPFQPEGPEPVAVPPQEQESSLKWMPPNVSATPAAMKRSDLPVFTATSAIPFAPRSGSGSSRPSSSGQQPVEEQQKMENVADGPGAS